MSNLFTKNSNAFLIKLLLAVSLTVTLSSCASFMVTHRAKNAPTNATLTVTYPNATKLEFEPKRLNIVAKYEAQNPEEEGVTTYTSKSKECSRLPISSSILDPLFGFLLCCFRYLLLPETILILVSGLARVAAWRSIPMRVRGVSICLFPTAEWFREQIAAVSILVATK